MIELIAGVTYRSGLLNGIEVGDALSNGQAPQIPMKTVKQKNQASESAVQEYLQRHGKTSSALGLAGKQPTPHTVGS